MRDESLREESNALVALHRTCIVGRRRLLFYPVFFLRLASITDLVRISFSYIKDLKSVVKSIILSIPEIRLNGSDLKRNFILSRRIVERS